MQAGRLIESGARRRGVRWLGVVGAAAMVSWLVAQALAPSGTSAALSSTSHAPMILPVTAAALLVTAFLLMWRGRSQTVDHGVRELDTGLYRRSYVEEMVANLAARDDRTGASQLSLLLIRIDHIDDIERRYGYAALSELVRVTGRLIRSQSRDSDLPTRDRDGFCVYLQCDEPAQVDAFCRRLSMLLDREQFALRGDEVKLSISTGHAIRQPGESIERLQARALAALKAERATERAA